MYAIIDIETTGGKYNEEAITEIAIYKFDGNEIIDQFSSLINPEKTILPYVTKLTGINNAMLRSAPKFYEVAKRIIEITDGCIVVGHNVDFDYRILKTEFKRLGYQYIKPTICTLNLSKRLLPSDIEYFSLGKLARTLGIPISDRHRAGGDALATLKLFSLLISKDTEKQALKSLIKKDVSKGVLEKWSHIVDKLPASMGIVYVYDDKGNIIYITKTKNIYKKACDLFVDNSKIAKQIQQHTFNISYEETANDLISFLREREEIQEIKPMFNKKQRKSLFLFGLYVDKYKNGNLCLCVSKLDRRRKEIKAFKNETAANEYLLHITQDLKINDTLSAKEKNSIIKAYIDQENEKLKNTIIKLKGRKIGEKSAILIENGELKGYCLFDLNYQITNPNILKNILVPLKNSKENINIIKDYLNKNTDYKIIRF